MADRLPATAGNVQRTIDAVWRMESAKLIAALTRMVRDVGVAEDLAQDALVAALERWPETGVPDNPGAWLMAAAKRRAIDQFRQHALHDRKHQELVPEFEAKQEAIVPELDEALDVPEALLPLRVDANGLVGLLRDTVHREIEDVEAFIEDPARALSAYRAAIIRHLRVQRIQVS